MANPESSNLNRLRQICERLESERNTDKINELLAEMEVLLEEYEKLKSRPN